MKRRISLCATLLMGALLATACSSTECASVEEPQHTLLFSSGDLGSKFFRIPALATAADGSLVAVVDKRNDALDDLPNLIDLVSKRSTDGGLTWSETIPVATHEPDMGVGDAALVLERNSGDLLCIYASGCGTLASRADAPMAINVLRSSDNGQSWGAHLDITDQIYGSACANPASQGLAGAFATSGSATQLSDGTLLFVIVSRTSEKRESLRPLSNFVCISEDGGYHWELLPAPACEDGDESKVVELNSGAWLMSIRNVETPYRRYAISLDRGESWSEVGEWEEMPAPSCNGDMIRYTSTQEGFERSRLLHSTPLHKTKRQDVAVLMSYDEGRSWPVCRVVWPEPAAYSSLTVLPDGDIGLLTEVGDYPYGFSIYFTRLSPEWLSEGADSYR